MPGLELFDLDASSGFFSEHQAGQWGAAGVGGVLLSRRTTFISFFGE